MPEWVVVLLGGGCGIVGAVIGFMGQRLTMTNQEYNRFRLAAIDRRLEVAQEAFYRAGTFAKVMGNRDARHSFEVECFEWWEKNCLYLAPDVRNAFESCLNRADLAADASTKEGREVLTDILMLRSKIEKSIGLPDLGNFQLDEEGAAPR